ncbi:stage V sporulation protein D [Jeotgalibacillus haloalkalitolerans]|uniref:Stage V sporulation protein D n=1 Tax=Jeotgalibacillus haloalkalitolerans TaxID=3104292 RepID=A0ABU5KK59_9BACL|nr:stage V sporulation protein D [Jeotgalibacillus sp. HH7-29]MDZ5711565.1 stage V sporulation protein D [Jeotgalibacillus sp. HH7-29]
MQHFSERLLKKRLVVVFLLFLILLFVVIVRLFYVQVVSHEQLYDKAIESWTRELPLEPKRGTIYDRNGKPIVLNESAPSLFIIPKQIEDRDHTAAELSDILKMPLKKAGEFVSRKGSIEKLHPEGRKLSYDQVRALEGAALPGVYIADDYKRSYPHGRMLSHVLGFIGVDNRGLSGLELLYDQQLYGTQGAEGLFTDAKGKEMEKAGSYHKDPAHGMDLHLTIDLDVQNVLERELTNAQEKYEADQILAIAMNPKTGEILGMASRPDFDPANYQKFSPDIYNRVLPIWRTYEPGSTFKIITLAAALEEGLVDLENESFYDSGHVEVGGAHLHCWQREGHGSQTFLEVVQNSCNPGFIELGNRLGKDRLLSYIHDFGFGQKTGIDLTGEASGILFKPENMGPVEQATTAFGQGVSVTPIQQAAAVSAVINGGSLPTPTITKKWTDPETGETVKEVPVKMKKKVISEDVSAEMREALESVVAQGTGRGAFAEGYRVGGKTGTAQKVENGQYMKDSYIVSFIGFAPSDDPEILVYLAVDHPKNTIQFGGVVAAPIVGNIIEESLNVMGVEKRKDQIEKEIRWTDPPEVKVPDVTGKTKSELLEMHLPVKLDIKGEGKKVIRQSPEPGTVISEGGTLRIFIGQ